MLRVLSATLLVTLVLGAPQFEDDHLHFEDTDGGDAPVKGWSEEETTKLNLEDPASWSASTEVLDDNHAWFRRRRSAESRVDAAEDVAADLEPAKSVVFMPARLRHLKKQAHEECRRRLREFSAHRRQVTSRNHCNSYCCYPVEEV